MPYDKESFIAGISVGTQLKGWASAGGSFGGQLSDITVRSQQTTFIEYPAEGFYGIGSVTVEGDEDLVPKNIKYGVTILGVTGTYSPADPKVTSKSATITENGTYVYYPSSGSIGISSMKVIVDVPINQEVIDAVLQSKSVTPNRDGQTVTPDNGFDGLASVYVAGDNNLVSSNIRDGVTIFGVKGSYENTEVVDAALQSKSVTPARGSQTVMPDNGYDGLSSVYIAGDNDLISSNIREGVTIFGVEGSYSSGQVYQSKTITPTRYGVTVTADNGYNALSQVTVKGDSNLTAGKIANGETIFGVKGTYISPMKPVTVIPSLDEQYIVPADGFYGFSSITVLPAEASGDYNEGFAAGAASRDSELEELQIRINELMTELTLAYASGYKDGYDAGASDIGASYRYLDEEVF